MYYHTIIFFSKLKSFNFFLINIKNINMFTFKNFFFKLNNVF